MLAALHKIVRFSGSEFQPRSTLFMGLLYTGPRLFALGFVPGYVYQVGK
jgi:hypothetical protein